MILLPTKKKKLKYVVCPTALGFFLNGGSHFFVIKIKNVT